MTDISNDPQAPGTGTSGAHPAKGVRKGLPTQGLRQAEESATRLWEVARRGMTAKEAFAKEVGMTSVKGGAWDKRMALLNGFGIIKLSDTEIGLSDLGLDLVQDFDESKRRAARRKAFFNLKAYRELVDDFDGTELPEKGRLAGKLQFEYGKTEEFAQQAADSFIDSLLHAGLLDANNYVRKDGVVSAVRTETGVQDADRDDETDEIDAAFGDEGDGEDGAARERELLIRSVPHDADMALSLRVTLDLSRYRADEVVDILRALGFASRG